MDDVIVSDSVKSLAFMFLFEDDSRSFRLPKLFSTFSESPLTVVNIDLVHSFS